MQAQRPAPGDRAVNCPTTCWTIRHPARRRTTPAHARHGALRSRCHGTPPSEGSDDLRRLRDGCSREAACNCATGRCAIGGQRERWSFVATGGVTDRRPEGCSAKSVRARRPAEGSVPQAPVTSGQTRPRRQLRQEAASCSASSSTSASCPSRSRSMFVGCATPSSVRDVLSH